MLVGRGSAWAEPQKPPSSVQLPGGPILLYELLSVDTLERQNRHTDQDSPGLLFLHLCANLYPLTVICTFQHYFFRHVVRTLASSATTAGGGSLVTRRCHVPRTVSRLSDADIVAHAVQRRLQ